ncbi:hypothetical protein RIF29_20263 [Crotalaria pallida]|uniref:Myosin motor domain-containing protein n=1 Tax=Crotalaria pallida TaxID=3830 RepID=A0AAN9F5A4_CROPI
MPSNQLDFQQSCTHFQKPGGIIALLDEAWSPIKLIFSSTRTKIKLLQNTKHFFMLPNAPLYQQQLQALLETLSATEPQYIRCVKPNNLLKPAIFENKNVLQQLRCGGVMEAIRINCSGFPTRKTFDEFVARFSLLAPEVLDER